MGTGGGRRAVPAPFLTKTHRMVENGETDDVISWGKDGGSFIVWKPVEFANELLPIHFKHNRFSSFVRQLNTYGFRKVMSDRWEFANDKFRRGEESLLSEIQRRRRSCPQSAPAALLPPLPPPPQPTTTTASTDSPESPSSPSTSPQSPPVSKLTDLTSENAKLKQEKQTLTMEIARTKMMCENMLATLSRYVNTKGMNMQLLMEEGSMESLEHMLNSQSIPEEAVEDTKEGSVKLFGALLKVSLQKDNKRKPEWSENEGNVHSIGERPMKIAPWIHGSPSFQPGSSKVSN
ncbi:heat shock transcription factor B2A [Rhynchospora pubera]|uniref:Heat shock transcription factor B2A n=2 Tax=Rhynchospora pubera TaxID=906938 RepID=A0AAV8HCJ8_9POAL|nr:heat shock transcription factor B2A [Rhynchospora pubera]